ncbi:serine/threonine-protein kinase [Actinosynnema sp. NPDC050801]|uniref:serine/threonine-protein kinase n=1 Tax=unclassified Actinosynnema TaxID=2637065 RepID=UPI0033C57F18
MVPIDRLPGYRVTSTPVRSGPFAVAPAVRESDGADVAVRVVVEPLDRATLRRFRTEVSATATVLEELRNPWIVPLVDHGQTADARPFLVTEGIGTSFADELAQRGPLPTDEVLRVVLTTAPALVSLHEAGVLHRGLGPAALIRQPGGRVLLDVPVVPVLAEIAAASTSGSGHEPLEVLNGGDWTPEAEVYAFASTVWTLLTGRPPVTGSWAERLLHLLDDTAPPPVAPPRLSPHLVGVLREALERRPEYRPRSPASLAVRLRDGMSESLGDPAARRTTAPQRTTGTQRTMGTDYELLSQLGSGSTGTVWRALRRSDGREVAVKELTAEADADGTALTRMVREHATLRGLTHPHLVKVLDLVVDRGRAALVMEFVDGADLREMLRAGQVERGEGVRFLAEVASGLAHLHERRIIHRDVKPANILVRTAGDRRRALLTDFGLAKQLGAPDLTRVGLLLGTPSYLAPELIASGVPTPEADVYALGVTAYEVLAGRRPFPGATTDEVLHQHRTRLPDRPAGLPDPAWRFLLACLEKDPRARPGAAEAADVLHDLVRDLTLSPAQPAEATSGAGVTSGAEATDGAEEVTRTSYHRVGNDEAPDAALTRTSARRPEPAPPAADTRPRRRYPRVVATVAAAAVAVVASGYGIGVFVANIFGSDEITPSRPPSSTVHRVRVDAVVEADGGVSLSWPAEATALPGLDRFVVMQGTSLRAEVDPGTTTYRDPRPRESGCYYVIALGTTAPPPDPAPQPACPTR